MGKVLNKVENNLGVILLVGCALVAVAAIVIGIANKEVIQYYN